MLLREGKDQNLKIPSYPIQKMQFCLAKLEVRICLLVGRVLQLYVVINFCTITFAFWFILVNL
jgi:hypothetical protein